MTRKCQPKTYIACALKIARNLPEFSAQHVAYRAHRKVSKLDGRDWDADMALSASGLFERASFINANRFGITTWRVKS